jgi:hypothetical protein
MARFRFARLRGHIQLWIRRTLIAAGKPPMDELLRIVAAVGITLAVAALAVCFSCGSFLDKRPPRLRVKAASWQLARSDGKNQLPYRHHSDR